MKTTTLSEFIKLKVEYPLEFKIWYNDYLWMEGTLHDVVSDNIGVLIDYHSKNGNIRGIMALSYNYLERPLKIEYKKIELCVS